MPAVLSLAVSKSLQQSAVCVDTDHGVQPVVAH